MERGSCFISYAGTDRELATLLVRELEAKGVRCWIAPRDIPPGQTYLAEIPKAIGESTALVLMLSKASMASDYVVREAEMALKMRKPMIPVRIEEVEAQGGLGFALGPSQWVDAFAEPRERTIIEMVPSIARSVGAEIADVSPPPPRPRKKFPFGKLSWLAGLLGLVILIGVVMSSDRALSDSALTKANDFDLQLELGEDRSEFRDGEKMSFRFQAAEDCYVALLQIAQDGGEYLLFPNAYSKDAFIRAGTGVIVPNETSDFEIEVGAPFGQETVYLIASTDEEDFASMLQDYRRLGARWNQESPYLALGGSRRALYIKSLKEEDAAEDAPLRAYAVVNFATKPAK